MAKGSGSSRSKKQEKKAQHDLDMSKKQSLLAEGNLNIIEQKAMEWIIAHLQSNHSEILTCKASLENGMCKHVADLVGDSPATRDYFHNTYVNFNALPKYWIAEWMVSHCGFKQEFVDLLGSGAPGQLRQVFTFFTGCSEFSFWPRPLLRKDLLVELLSFMCVQLGSRYKNSEKHVSAQGKISWSTAGVYKFEWAEIGGEPKYIQTITHISDTEALIINMVGKSLCSLSPVMGLSSLMCLGCCSACALNPGCAFQPKPNTTPMGQHMYVCVCVVLLMPSRWKWTP